MKAYESRGQWFDIAKTVGGEIPGVKAILDGADKIPGDPLHDIFVGDAPTPADTARITTTSSEAMQHAIAQNLLNNNIGDSSAFGNLVDPDTGQLKPLDANLSNFQSAFNIFHRH